LSVPINRTLLIEEADCCQHHDQKKFGAQHPTHIAKCVAREIIFSGRSGD
jgi:hypothetical protein